MMTDPRPDPNPDSPPREEDRGSIEQVDIPPDRDDTPDPRNSAVGGTDGVVRNQDDDAQ